MIEVKEPETYIQDTNTFYSLTLYTYSLVVLFTTSSSLLETIFKT